MPKPGPEPDDLTKPFWDACNERRLIVQTCSACDRKQYPPEQTCRQCGSKENLEWREVTGKGRIHGYCVMHDSRLRLLQEGQPFNIAVIELLEDPEIKFFSHLPGSPPDNVPVGAIVESFFEESVSGQLLHEWKIVDAAPPGVEIGKYLAR